MIKLKKIETASTLINKLYCTDEYLDTPGVYARIEEVKYDIHYGYVRITVRWAHSGKQVARKITLPPCVKSVRDIAIHVMAYISSEEDSDLEKEGIRNE